MKSRKNIINSIYQSLARLRIDIETISIFKLMKFKCWFIKHVSNIIWKYKNITIITATTVVLLLIRSVNAELIAQC